MISWWQKFLCGADKLGLVNLQGIQNENFQNLSIDVYKFVIDHPMIVYGKWCFCNEISGYGNKPAGYNS